MPTSNDTRVRVRVFWKIMPEHAPREQLMRLAGLLLGLQLGRQAQQALDLGRREVVEGEEAPPLIRSP